VASWPSGINSCERGPPNRCNGRWLRVGVLSVAVKRRRNLRQVGTTKMSESEPSDDGSKDPMTTSEPGLTSYSGISLAGVVAPGQAGSGVQGA